MRWKQEQDLLSKRQSVMCVDDLDGPNRTPTMVGDGHAPGDTGGRGVTGRDWMGSRVEVKGEGGVGWERRHGSGLGGEYRQEEGEERRKGCGTVVRMIAPSTYPNPLQTTTLTLAQSSRIAQALSQSRPWPLSHSICLVWKPVLLSIEGSNLASA